MSSIGSKPRNRPALRIVSACTMGILILFLILMIAGPLMLSNVKKQATHLPSQSQKMIRGFKLSPTTKTIIDKNNHVDGQQQQQQLQKKIRQQQRQRGAMGFFTPNKNFALPFLADSYDGLSIVAWIRLDNIVDSDTTTVLRNGGVTTRVSSSPRTVISTSSSPCSSSSSGYKLSIEGSYLIIAYAFAPTTAANSDGDDNVGCIKVTSQRTLPLEQWVHIGVSIGNTSSGGGGGGLMTLYMNGIVVGRSSDDGDHMVVTDNNTSNNKKEAAGRQEAITSIGTDIEGMEALGGSIKMMGVILGQTLDDGMMKMLYEAGRNETMADGVMRDEVCHGDFECVMTVYPWDDGGDTIKQEMSDSQITALGGNRVSVFKTERLDGDQNGGQKTNGGSDDIKIKKTLYFNSNPKLAPDDHTNDETDPQQNKILQNALSKPNNQNIEKPKLKPQSTINDQKSSTSDKPKIKPHDPIVTTKPDPPIITKVKGQVVNTFAYIKQKQKQQQELQHQILSNNNNPHQPHVGRAAFYHHVSRSESDTLARKERRTAIRNAMTHAWNGYVTYAMGKDELLPLTKEGLDAWGGMAVTLLDSLDTLWLMGLHSDFNLARDWVSHYLEFENVKDVSFFETTIRCLGGLLSAYDWSRDKIFLDKAHDLGKRLAEAFTSRNGLPYSRVSLRSGTGKNNQWAGRNVILSEMGTVQLEFRYLANATGDLSFANKANDVFLKLAPLQPPSGLYPVIIPNDFTETVRLPRSGKITLGAYGDSFYEYILKMWLQGGKKEVYLREMYDNFVDGVHENLLIESPVSGLTYVAQINSGGLSGRVAKEMDHLVCFVGGLFALGAYHDPRGMNSTRAQRDLETAKKLAYTCYQMYAHTATGLSPDIVVFDNGNTKGGGTHSHGLSAKDPDAASYKLRPETIETFYILHEITGDHAYREWGWEIFQSIEKYCKTEVGYGMIKNVYDEKAKPEDKMESFFLGETLKYLYLLNDPDKKVDVLNKHVFNTEAHPLRIFESVAHEDILRQLIKSDADASDKNDSPSPPDEKRDNHLFIDMRMFKP